MRTIRSGVYVIRNVVTGHEYVGSSVDMTNRKGKHISQCRNGNHPSPYLQKAWNKYGEDNFVFDVLEEGETYDRKRGRTDLEYRMAFKTAIHAREQHFIDLLKPAYNCLPIAGSRLGFQSSPETKARMKEIAFARPPMSEATKVRISESKQGQNLGGTSWNAGLQTGARSEETIAKISAAQKGVSREYAKVPCTEEKAAKISAAQKGKPRLYKARAGTGLSGTPGVIFDKSRNKWQVRIKGKQYGRYTTLEEAVTVADRVNTLPQ